MKITEREFKAGLVAELKALKHFALTLCRQAQDADDLVQSTVLHALERRSEYTPGCLRSWLFKMMQNLHLDEVRSAYRQRSDFYSFSNGGPKVSALITMPRQYPYRRYTEVRDHVSTMPPHLRRIMELTAVEYSRHELVEMLGVPLGTVLSRIARARKRLELQMES